MNGDHAHKDLLVLVADLDIEQAIRGLLGRPHSLNISEVEFEVRRHPGRDSGCRSGAVEFLRSFLGSYRYALVVFDLHGSGNIQSRVDIRNRVEDGLSRNGWDGRARAIVIEPELEEWVWTASQGVAEVLGWKGSYASLREWLHTQELWPEGSGKPCDPKAAMKLTMYKSRSRRSSRKFYELATRVSLEHCEDPAFNELRTTLRAWFPRR